MHGNGLYKWADGRTYEGEYQNDKKHVQKFLKISKIIFTIYIYIYIFDRVLEHIYGRMAENM